MIDHLRKRCFNLITHKSFDYVIMSFIILNTIVMLVSHFGESYIITQTLDILNYIFAIIFTIEMILKLIGLGFKQYFSDGWNIFDCCVTVGSDIGVILKLSMGSSNLSVLLVVRAFRIGRVFRLIQSAKSLRTLFNTLVLTLPSLANVSGILLLFFFIYAIIGLQLFATVKNGDYIGDYMNFRSFGMSLLTLFRCSTGEVWNLIMYDCITLSDCENDVLYNPDMCGFSDKEDCIPLNGCGTNLGYLYFFSFTVLISWILLQLFIGVIMDGFGDINSEEHSKLTPEQYDAFVDVWNSIFIYFIRI